MKQIIIGFALMLLLHFGYTVSAQEKNAAEICYNPNAKGDTTKRSIKSAAIGNIAPASIKINYHSPGVRGRTIWGGLVPYGEVWVTGAHNATNIEIDKDFKVNGVAIPKGKYAFFTIPGKNEWTIIINKNWNQHLADDYQQTEDLIRIKVQPIRQPANSERLQFFISDKGNNNGSISMLWENIKIELELVVDR
ncbi:MAG: DUF2911 domain-containing protein [Chitinophagaceae bacterium]|nr:DUF2911 domain-containing protein [Chitinophagaceae bacterium]